MSHAHPRRHRRAPGAAILLALLIAAPLRAQYPVAPTPAFGMRALTATPRLSGYISLRNTWRDDTATFIVNRARLTAVAAPLPYAAVRVQADFSTVGRTRGDTVPAILLTDAYLELAPADTTSGFAALRPALLLGQFKTPFSLEYLTSYTSVITPDRSEPVDRLASKRDLGAMAQLSPARFVRLMGAVVNGEGPNRTTNGDGKEMLIGRVTLLPLPALALSAKWLGVAGDHRWGYDARFVTGRVILEGEYIRRNSDASGATSGGYLLAAVRPLPWLQPVVKWERFQDVRVVTPGGPFEPRLTWTTLGVNVLGARDRLRLQVAWISRSERPVDRSDEVIAQLQAIF